MILVVDDNEVSQLVMRVLLERLGFQCEIACSGREAIEMFRVKAYSLVLMDLAMPGMDGLQTARALRVLELRRGGRTPIVAITAMDEELVRADCIAAGMDDLHAKPVEADALANQIARWTRVDRPADAARLPTPAATPAVRRTRGQ
ncbi:MAG TPA: response regulator [Polyangiaceae bacterium]